MEMLVHREIEPFIQKLCISFSHRYDFLSFELINFFRPNVCTFGLMELVKMLEQKQKP